MTRAGAVIVDDHALVRSAIRQALESSGIEVLGETASGSEAVRLAVADGPDLVILDLDLPGMHGLDVLSALRDEAPDVRVLVLTVSGAHADLLEAVRRGAAGYVTKDVNPEELLRAVQATLAGEMPLPPRMTAGVISALASGDRPEPGAGLSRLTPRETEVLSLIADGLTDRQAAATLRISIRTVEDHVSSVLHKLGARSRARAAATYRAQRQAG